MSKKINNIHTHPAQSTLRARLLQAIDRLGKMPATDQGRKQTRLLMVITLIMFGQLAVSAIHADCDLKYHQSPPSNLR